MDKKATSSTETIMSISYAAYAFQWSNDFNNIFRLSRRKRTRIWILSLVIENETVWDEVDVYIETQKRRDRTRSRFFSV